MNDPLVDGHLARHQPGALAILQHHMVDRQRAGPDAVDAADRDLLVIGRRHGRDDAGEIGAAALGLGQHDERTDHRRHQDEQRVKGNAKDALEHCHQNAWPIPA
ncbi:hypothetical protein [Mesorhizobium sp.]|uniref:hypothetical protein n=1 Tax=Mesorhizobium sp. TaxID=1871066 RepID=UPI00257FB168|nr:hypothetical protein [Mesorhizobium sp.]